MKQIEYTKEQELVIGLLKPFIELTQFSQYSVDKRELIKLIKQTQEKFKIRPKYLTVRQYINEYMHGAYHHFIFTINGYDVDVCSVSEFARTFNINALDKYFVIKDDKTDNGGNCENYRAEHRLTLSEVEI